MISNIVFDTDFCDVVDVCLILELAPNTIEIQIQSRYHVKTQHLFNRMRKEGAT